MALQVICKVLPGGLRCVNDAESTKLENLIGKEVQVTVKQPRNLKFHRKFFAMLNMAQSMADVTINPEQWRHLVLAGAGYCTFHKIGDKMVAIPVSISFSSMDEVEFSQLYSDCLDFICLNYVDDTPESLNAMLQFM